jgi:uncharacterized protein YndB with AHSA1/START domain
MQLTQTLVATAGMLVRRPVADVFEAFVDPAITSKFWFTKGSGRLEPGKQVRWEWEMYHVAAQVNVIAVEQNRRIFIEWPEDGTTVEWRFTARGENETFITITNEGFRGAGDEIVKKALNATEAFTLVLAGAKALLEHNVVLNLVADRFPGGLEQH